METTTKTINGFINSPGFKLGLIGILTLLLLIPANLILDLIREREQRRSETVYEVTSVWGNAQTILGPVITLPYEVTVKTGKDTYINETRYAHFLPEKLNVEGKVEPEVRYRGIYKVVTYSTKLRISGTFAPVDASGLTIPVATVENMPAMLEIGIPDMRGINKDISVQWGDTNLPVIPGLPNSQIASSGVHANFRLDGKKSYIFSFDLDLNGSLSLNFIPVGKETNVHLSSTWTSPSFNGSFLPDSRKVDEKGFQAEWNVLQLNRNYPQQWIDDQYTVSESLFGVELLTPVDTYRKSERSVKYAILFIALTFLVFFFAEVMTKTRIHFINYLLTGIALCIFYSLLTALAEHISFTLAYVAASVIIIAMIALFANSLYRKRQVTLTVAGTLVALYVFLFVILQLMDYSLLFGNIGLVIILGIVMYFSRKIDWYSPERTNHENN